MLDPDGMSGPARVLCSVYCVLGEKKYYYYRRNITKCQHPRSPSHCAPGRNTCSTTLAVLPPAALTRSSARSPPHPLPGKEI
jgi:hypothetical protein